MEVSVGGSHTNHVLESVREEPHEEVVDSRMEEANTLQGTIASIS